MDYRDIAAIGAERPAMRFASRTAGLEAEWITQPTAEASVMRINL